MPPRRFRHACRPEHSERVYALAIPNSPRLQPRDSTGDTIMVATAGLVYVIGNVNKPAISHD